MKAISFFSILVATIGSSALADYDLAYNQRAVLCHGEDNQSWTLNKRRTTLKYTIEGESAGPNKIIKTESDGVTYVSYTTSEGTLILGDQGDSFRFRGAQEVQEIRCY